MSAVHAYHIVAGVAYSLGPVTLYLMAVFLGASRGGAFLSALCYSLFSPSTLLMPSVARDMSGYLYGRRLQVLTVYGEGPHIAVMTLLPLVIVALEYALRKRTGRAFGLAALALAVVFLTNVPGTMGTGLAVFCWLAVQTAGSRRAAWTIASRRGASGIRHRVLWHSAFRGDDRPKQHRPDASRFLGSIEDRPVSARLDASRGDWMRLSYVPHTIAPIGAIRGALLRGHRRRGAYRGPEEVRIAAARGRGCSSKWKWPSASLPALSPG